MKRIGWAVCLVVGTAAAFLASTSAAAQAGGPAARGGKELMAVVDLEPVGATEAEASALTERLREELLNSGRYTLVDRAQMKQILDEQAFQQAGCTSMECAVQVGKILGVRKLVTGKITKLGDDRWLLSAQIVDVETAQTERARSVPYKGDFFSMLVGGVQELVAKLSGAPTAPEAIPEAAGPPVPKSQEAAPPERLAREPEGERHPLLVYGVPIVSLRGVLKHDASETTETIAASGVGVGINYGFATFGELFGELYRGQIDGVTQSGPNRTAGSPQASGAFSGTVLGVHFAARFPSWTLYIGPDWYSWSLEYKLNDLLFHKGQRVSGDLRTTGLALDFGARYAFPSRFFVGAGMIVHLTGSLSGSRRDAFADNHTPSNAGSGSVLVVPFGYAF